MEKKHLIAYPLTAILAFATGAAGSGTSTATTAATPTATTTVTVPASSDGQPAQTVTAPAQTVTVTQAPEPATTTEAAAATFPGDGTYEVGVDIQPGKYSSDTPTSGNCYWARLKNDDPFDGILANNNSSGKSVVVIKKSDKYFQTSGCSDWTKR